MTFFSFYRGRRFLQFTKSFFCLTAVLLLTLSPLLHGLHLSTCNHKHNVGKLGNHQVCNHDKQGSAGSTSKWPAIRSRQGIEDRQHNPYTCPLCRTFAQLMQGGWFTPSQINLGSTEIHQSSKHSKRIVPRTFFSLNSNPRDPPFFSI